MKRAQEFKQKFEAAPKMRDNGKDEARRLLNKALSVLEKISSFDRKPADERAISAIKRALKEF